MKTFLLLCGLLLATLSAPAAITTSPGSGGGGSATNVSGGSFTGVTLSGNSTIAGYVKINGNAAGLTNLPATPYPVEYFGAIGDGDTALSCVLVSGSKTLYAPAGHFVAGDSNKVVMVYGTNQSAPCFTTTISNIVSTTNVTLLINSPQTLSLATIVYGSNDRLAVQLALNTITNWPPGPPIYFDENKIYVVDGTQTNAGVISQLFVPNPPTLSTNRRPTLTLTTRKTMGGGFDKVGDANNMFRGKGGGAILWSTFARGRNGVTNDCFIQCTPGTAGFNYLNLNLENLTLRGAFDNNLIMVDAYGAWAVDFVNVQVDSGYVQGLLPYFPLTGTNGIRFRLPNPFNDNRQHLDNCWAFDGWTGFEMNGNTLLDNPKAFTCVNAFSAHQSGNGINKINHALVMECSNAFSLPSGFTMQISGEFHSANYVYATNRTFKVINTDGGSLIGSMRFDTGNIFANPDDQICSFIITNSLILTSGALDLIQDRSSFSAYHFTGADFAQHVSIFGDIGASGMTYGDLAQKPFTVATEVNGVGGWSNPNNITGWQFNASDDGSLIGQAWNTTNQFYSAWTNKFYSVYNFTFMTTNANTATFFIGFETYGATARLGLRQYQRTVTTTGTSIFTLTATNNEAGQFNNCVSVRPFVYYAGDATNAVWFINGSWEFRTLQNGPY